MATSYLIRQLPTVTAIIDNEANFVAVSDKWADFFSSEPKDFSSKSIHDIFGNAEIELKELLNHCIAEQKECHHIVQLNLRDKLFIRLISKPWFDESENPIGILVNLEDISKQISLEEKNKKLYHLLDETAEISKVGMWEFDLETNNLSWSKMTKKIHEVAEDYTPEVNTAINFYKEGHSRNTVSMRFQKALDKGEPFSDRLQILTAKGRELWIRNAGKPIYKDGKLIKIIGTFQDVDEQVRSEMKIRENEKLLESIIDNLPLNVYVKDKDSKKIMVNKSECEYLGVKHKSQLIGKDDFDIYPKEIAQISREEDVEVIKHQKPVIGRETKSVKKDGVETTFLTSKIPLTGIYGNAIGIIGISMDISTLKKKEAELKDLINVTALQNKKLSNFAHIVSHNLRSHSANFAMLLNFLVDEKDESEKERITKMLVNASQNLMSTLEDLNEVVDVNANVNLDKEKIDLNEKLAKVKQDLATFLNENRAKIINKVPKGTKVFAVHAYLESVLLNLLTNAVKYQHPDRTPEITLRIETGASHTILLVQDNGLGIDLEKNGNNLFGMYKTFHNNKDARGMGLYITKNQMEAMGGNITAESEVGIGTIFKVYFNEN
ncbi:PAS domain S-box protein [Allomuricauda sp. d1]|uniref:PAS domain-containing sensor histidine kinase n=1 Tax=Allomuricauda sp. d1 TaxID=3136725 RepID=UPI0031DD3584